MKNLAFSNLVSSHYFRALNVGLVFLLFIGTIAHAQNNVFVSNTSAGTVTQIDPNGDFSIFASGLDNPEGLAFDSAGNLYVANSGDGTIAKINSAGTVSTFASGLNSPTALAFDPSGNLYVGNTGNQTISKIDSSGNASVFATDVRFGGNGAYLATDSAGNVYANSFDQQVPVTSLIKYDANGNESTVIAGSDLAGIAVDGAGNIYLAIQNGNGIVSIGNGSLLIRPNYLPAPYNNGDSFFDNAADLVFDANGNLYATYYDMVYMGGPGGGNNVGVTYVHNVLVEFGVNGVNTLVANEIGGDYIAVEPVPEPSALGLLAIGATAQLVRRRYGSK